LEAAPGGRTVYTIEAGNAPIGRDAGFVSRDASVRS